MRAALIGMTSFWLAACISLAQPAARVVTVTLIDGNRVNGELTGVFPELTLRTAQADRSFAWAEVLELAQPVASGSPPGAPLWIELADGSQFAASLEPGEGGTHVEARLADNQLIRLATSMIAAVRNRAMSAELLARFEQALSQPDAQEDLAVVAKEREVALLRGSIQAMDAAQVRFAWKGKELALPWQRVVGIASAQATMRAGVCLVSTADGQRFAGRVSGGDAREIVLESPAYSGLQISWDQISSIAGRGAHVTFLSDLKPLQYEFEPLLWKSWELALDRDLAGGPLRVGGQVISKGVCMHSRSRASYALNGEYRQFAAQVAIADAMGSRGRADARVRGDGRLLWRGEALRGGQAPQPILLDTTGVQTLTLEVDYGDDLDISDEICWAMARLIR